MDQTEDIGFVHLTRLLLRLGSMPWQQKFNWCLFKCICLKFKMYISQTWNVFVSPSDQTAARAGLAAMTTEVWSVQGVSSTRPVTLFCSYKGPPRQITTTVVKILAKFHCLFLVCVVPQGPVSNITAKVFEVLPTVTFVCLTKPVTLSAVPPPSPILASGQKTTTILKILQLKFKKSIFHRLILPYA